MESKLDASHAVLADLVDTKPGRARQFSGALFSLENPTNRVHHPDSKERMNVGSPDISDIQPDIRPDKIFPNKI